MCNAHKKKNICKCIIEMSKYVSYGEVNEMLGITVMTLRNMRHRGDIEAIKIGNKYAYNLNKYLDDNKINRKEEPKQNKRNIIYCRVSSNKQKEDLKRQINDTQKIYPKYEIITDVGSGLNFNRKGLTKLIDYAIKGEINEVVITYKDRLARIGFEMIENIIKTYSNGKITIINKTEEETPTDELVKDVVSIMNVYVAKINGLRKHTNAMRRDIRTYKY